MNKGRIQYRTFVTQQQKPGESILVIINATEEHIATFTCEAQNGVEDSEGNVIVKTEDVKVTVEGELFCNLWKFCTVLKGSGQWKDAVADMD